MGPELTLDLHVQLRLGDDAACSCLNKAWGPGSMPLGKSLDPKHFVEIRTILCAKFALQLQFCLEASEPTDLYVP